MAYQKGGVGTLAEIEEWCRSNKVDSTTIELLNQTNDIMDDIPFREANRTVGHESRLRTALPEVYFRRLYKGTPVSKAGFQTVIEDLTMLESRMELDVKEKELYPTSFSSYRLSEARAHTEALRQKAATLMFYGNRSTNPDEFNGLATRYGALSVPNVVDAGGTGDNLTSLYFVSWGADTTHGLFPKDSVGGLKHEDLGTYMATDSAGNSFRVVGDEFSWNIGLAVRDWRSVVRIANIDLSQANLSVNDDGFIDINKLAIEAKNKMPEQMRNRGIWYCNSDLLTMIEKQALDYNNLHLQKGDAFGSKGVPFLHYRPIRQCDAILTAEDAVE